LYLTTFSSFVSFRKIDWHASDPARVLSQLCFGLLCAWRGVLILRQQEEQNVRIAAAHRGGIK
jgi:hypothetical protein